MRKKNYSKHAARFYKDRGKRNYTPLSFDLKAPEKEKYANDGQWFKDYAEWIVPANNEVVDDYQTLKDCYDIVNGNLDNFKEKFKKFCNPLQLPDVGEDDFIEPYPKIHNKINVLKGELLKRGDNFRVVLLTSKAIKDKNKQMVESIRESVERELGAELQKMQMMMEGMSEEEMAQFEEELREELTPEDIAQKDFLADWEIFHNKILKYAYYDQDIKLKQMGTFEDLCTADKFFVYSGFKHGKPYLEERNTLFTGYHKSPNQYFVHKGDYVWYKKAVTTADIYNEYQQYLDDDQLEELMSGSANNNHRVDGRHDVMSGNARAVFDHNKQHLTRDLINKTEGVDSIDALKQVGNSMSQGYNNASAENQLHWETHIEFKAFKEVIFLTYNDDYNESITTVLDGKARNIISDDAEKVNKINMYGDYVDTYVWTDPVSETVYEAMILYIPRKYEVIRLGEGIYPIYREVPFQRTNINAPYSSFELSTKGVIGSARNSPSVSLVQRALPAYFEYLYVKKVQNEELSKYQGFIQSIDVDQIPDELGQDEDGNPVRDKIQAYLLHLKKTNRDLYSGSQSSLGALPPNTRSPGSSGYALGTAMELYNLQNLADMLDREIGMAMGISPQREAQFSSNSNVTDNQQAITQSHHITEPYFFLHNEVWRSALNDYLRNFITYCKTQLELNPESEYLIFDYIAPDGVRDLIKVTPDLLAMEDVGLWTSNNMKQQDYLQRMEHLSFSIAQNGGEGMEEISTIVKAITSDASPEEIHKMIQLASQKQKDRLQQAEEAQREHEASLAAAENERQSLEAQNRKDEIILQEALRKDREIEVMLTRYGIDADRDNIPDVVQKQKIENDKIIADAKLRLDEREIKRKEKDDIRKARLEEKKIAAMKQQKRNSK